MAARRRFVSDIPRTLLVAGLLAALFAAAAGQSTLLERLDADEAFLLASFAAAFAALTCACDGELRASVRRALGVRSTAAKSPAAKRAAT